jgi:lysophospholipase L1-like esterase
MPETRRILAYGDSLTWGWAPIQEVLPTTRYPLQERYTGFLAEALGPGYEIIEEGLSGRTTNADDPTDPRLNGLAYLPAALATHLPLDLVIILLGTNDTKAFFHREPFDIATGMATLLGAVRASAGGVGTAYPAPRALVVAPPPLGDVTHPWHGQVFAGGKQKTALLPPLYAAVAKSFGAEFFDGGSVTATDGVDGIHLTVDNNRALGLGVGEKVRAILG